MLPKKMDSQVFISLLPTSSEAARRIFNLSPVPRIFYFACPLVNTLAHCICRFLDQIDSILRQAETTWPSDSLALTRTTATKIESRFHLHTWGLGRDCVEIQPDKREGKLAMISRVSKARGLTCKVLGVVLRL